MHNLSKRIITSVVLIFILLLSLFYNKYMWLFVLILASLVLFIEFNNLAKKIWKKKKNTIVITHISSLLFLVTLIFFAYDLHSKRLSDLIFIISICIFSDTGGYIVGNLIGGKKLTKISPNKTISGSVGSFGFSVLPIIFMSLYYEYLNFFNYPADDYLILISISLFLSLICQLGDLFISYFKRKAKANDTGSILPGHGGLLDRIDGVIFVIPVAYILNKLFF